MPKATSFALALSAIVAERPATVAVAPKATSKSGPQTPPGPPPPEATVDPRAAERALAARGRERAVAERARAATSEPVRDELVLDPSARSLAQLAPPASPAAIAPSEAPSPPARALDPTVMAAVVETAAFWGDGARGLARLRFGPRARGGLSGATVTLVQDDGAVAVRVEGADDAAVERLRDRLATAGIAIEPDR